MELFLKLSEKSGKVTLHITKRNFTHFYVTSSVLPLNFRSFYSQRISPSPRNCPLASPSSPAQSVAHAPTRKILKSPQLPSLCLGAISPTLHFESIHAKFRGRIHRGLGT